MSRTPPPACGVGLDDGAAAATTKNAMVGSMPLADGAGEARGELARRIRRVRAARLRHVAAAGGRRGHERRRDTRRCRDGPRPGRRGADADDGQRGRRRRRRRHGGGMALASNVLASVLQGHGRRGGRPAGGVAPPASSVRAQGHVVGRGGSQRSPAREQDDTLAGYAARLAPEAHGRIGRSATAARADSDEQDEDSRERRDRRAAEGDAAEAVWRRRRRGGRGENRRRWRRRCGGRAAAAAVPLARSTAWWNASRVAASPPRMTTTNPARPRAAGCADARDGGDGDAPPSRCFTPALATDVAGGGSTRRRCTDPHRLTIGVGNGLVAAFIAVGDGAVGAPHSRRRRRRPARVDGAVLDGASPRASFTEDLMRTRGSPLFLFPPSPSRRGGCAALRHGRASRARRRPCPLVGALRTVRGFGAARVP